jgi:hypothetical protein
LSGLHFSVLESSGNFMAVLRHSERVRVLLCGLNADSSGLGIRV